MLYAYKCTLNHWSYADREPEPEHTIARAVRFCMLCGDLMFPDRRQPADDVGYYISIEDIQEQLRDEGYLATYDEAADVLMKIEPDWTSGLDWIAGDMGIRREEDEDEDYN